MNHALPTLYLLNSTLVTDLLLQLSVSVCIASVHHPLTSPTGGWCCLVANTRFIPRILFWSQKGFCNQCQVWPCVEERGKKKAKAQEQQFAFRSSQGQQVGEGQPFPAGWEQPGVAGVKHFSSRCWHSSAPLTQDRPPSAALASFVVTQMLK